MRRTDKVIPIRHIPLLVHENHVQRYHNYMYIAIRHGSPVFNILPRHNHEIHLVMHLATAS